ncbi:MAG: hypothetical protein ACJAU6_002217 [Alphaproteobacteria bacterium]
MLLQFRAIASSGFLLATLKPDEEIVIASAARSAVASIDALNFLANFDSLGAARSASHSARSAARSATASAFYSSDAAASTYYFRVGTSQSWKEVSADALMVGESGGSLALLQAPLWAEDPPKWIMEDWISLKAALPTEENWQVWTDWYEDRLRGLSHPDSRPMIEALERERVLISNEGWDKGPKHVNALIAELEEKYRPEREWLQRDVVKEEIGQFQEKFRPYVAQYGGLGHNNPPPDEAISRHDFIAGHKRIVEFAQATNEILDECKNEKPDAAKIKKTHTLLVSLLKWLGEKANIYVDELMKWTARASAPIVVGGVAVWADILPSMSNFIQSVQTWQKLLP